MSPAEADAAARLTPFMCHQLAGVRVHGILHQIQYGEDELRRVSHKSDSHNAPASGEVNQKVRINFG